MTIGAPMTSFAHRHSLDLYGNRHSLLTSSMTVESLLTSSMTAGTPLTYATIATRFNLREGIYAFYDLCITVCLRVLPRPFYIILCVQEVVPHFI